MKIQSLRAAIVAAFPDFETDPDRLCMWAEKGSARCTLTVSQSFEWEYVANITLAEFAGHPSLLFETINDWLRDNQPDLLQPHIKQAYRFEVDILDENLTDLHIQIELTEAVVTVVNADGENLQHLDESTFLLTDDLPLGGSLKKVTTGSDQTLPGPPLP